MADKENKKTTKSENDVDWGKEVKKSGLIALKVSGKVLTYILNVLMTVLLICLITGTIVGIAFFVYINNYIEVDVSEIQVLSSNQNLTTKIYYMDYDSPEDRAARNGTPISIDGQTLYSSENRTWVSYEDMPTELVECFISIEDERFWEHEGVDWKRTAGATFYYVLGRASYGGSTITQQLIKNVTGNDDTTIQRKVQEIMTALELEKTMEKEQIIELYLNTIYLSQHCYGVQAASNVYFGKNVSELNLTECAALAALPKFPYKYDPYLNPDNNKDRRDDVLFKMHELGKITDSYYEKALNTDLVLAGEDGNAAVNSTTSWYTDAVIEDTIELLMERYGIGELEATQMMYTGGLQIYTVMDKDIQADLEEYFLNDDNFDRINDGVQPEASMVVIDPTTGDILALVGGRGEKTSSRVLNYATQTTRSPGSSMKPVAVYGPALEYGVINYGSIVIDSPVRGNWPVNYPAGYRGATTIHDAICRSVNTVAVKVLEKLGYQASYEFVHDKLGMKSVLYEYTTSSGAVLSDLNASALGLGGMTYGVTVREITGAYQIFANNGVFTGNRTVLKILDSKGEMIVDNGSKHNVVMSEANSDIMTMMLREVVQKGTASRMTLDEKINIAGKTGTTSNDYDRWFIGYSPYYLAGVWFGYAMPMSLNGFSETMSPALHVWEDVMRIIHDKYVFHDPDTGEAVDYVSKFTYSNDIVSAKICKESGLRATEYCDTESIETGYYIAGNIPNSYCTEHKKDEEEKDEEDKNEEDKDNEEGDTGETNPPAPTPDPSPEPSPEPEPDTGEDTQPDSNDPNVE